MTFVYLGHYKEKKVRILQSADVVPSRRSLRIKTEESSKLWEQLLLLSHNDIYTLHIYNSIYRVYINFDSLFSFLFEFCCCCLFRNYFSKHFFRLLSAVCLTGVVKAKKNV